MPVDTQHPEYLAMSSIWERARCAFAGEDSVKAKGETRSRLPDPCPRQRPHQQTLAGVLDITGGDSETYGLSVTNQASFNQVLINEDLQVRRTLHQLQTLTWAASIQIHFANYARYRVTLAGNTTFTSTGWLAGAEPEVHITCDATLRTLTWPAAWVWVGAAAPANIAANKRAVLKLRCIGTNESDVRARWLVEP